MAGNGEVDIALVAATAKTTVSTVERALLFDGAKTRSAPTRAAIVAALRLLGYRQEAKRIEEFKRGFRE